MNNQEFEHQLLVAQLMNPITNYDLKECMYETSRRYKQFRCTLMTAIDQLFAITLLQGEDHYERLTDLRRIMESVRNEELAVLEQMSDYSDNYTPKEGN